MLIARRNFLAGLAATTLSSRLWAQTVGSLTKTGLTSRERLERLLTGRTPDRTPYSIWQHLGIERTGPDAFARATVQYHLDYGTDFIKVMSDLSYPTSASKNWWDLKVIENPFPAQVHALELIHNQLPDQTYFIETVFSPWNVAEKLSTEAEVRRLKQENPQQLADALEVIAHSQANHVKRALATGASGIFLAVTAADESALTREDYRKWSEPYDRIVLDAARSAHFNVLHIHGSKVYLDIFYSGWPSAAINYSAAATGISLEQVKPHYAGFLIGGIDENAYRFLSVDDLKKAYRNAVREVGTRLIFAPGCTIPLDTSPEELRRLKAVFS
jgi:uroporphyrinogen decarboxylase